jgi:hypothetical protein
MIVRAHSHRVEEPSRSTPIPKLLTKNQMLGVLHTTDQSPRPKSLLVYISWYINGYGRPWTSSDPNPRMRPNRGQFAGSGGVLPATTEQKAFVAPTSGRGYRS